MGYSGGGEDCAGGRREGTEVRGDGDDQGCGICEEKQVRQEQGEDEERVKREDHH